MLQVPFILRWHVPGLCPYWYLTRGQILVASGVDEERFFQYYQDFTTDCFPGRSLRLYENCYKPPCATMLTT